MDLRPARHPAARDGRHRGPRADQGDRRGAGDHPGDRGEDGAHRGGGHEARRLRLRHQAVRRGRDLLALVRRGARASARWSARSSTCASRARAATTTSTQLVGQNPRDAAALPGDRAGGANDHDGADHGRERHRARSSSRAPSTTRARGATGLRRRQLRGDPRDLSRPSCSATRRAPSPAPSRASAGSSSWPHGGTLFLDEIGDIPLGAAGQAPARPAGARVRARRRHATPSRSTCALIAATNRDLRRRCADGALPRGPLLPPERGPPRRAAAARAAATTSRCSSTTSSRASASGTAQRIEGVTPETHGRCCRATAGRATSASCRTSSSGAVVLTDGAVVEVQDMPLDLVLRTCATWWTTRRASAPRGPGAIRPPGHPSRAGAGAVEPVRGGASPGAPQEFVENEAPCLGNRSRGAGRLRRTTGRRGWCTVGSAGVHTPVCTPV